MDKVAKQLDKGHVMKLRITSPKIQVEPKKWRFTKGGFSSVTS